MMDFNYPHFTVDQLVFNDSFVRHVNNIVLEGDFDWKKWTDGSSENKKIYCEAKAVVIVMGKSLGSKLEVNPKLKEDGLNRIAESLAKRDSNVKARFDWQNSYLRIAAWVALVLCLGFMAVLLNSKVNSISDNELIHYENTSSVNEFIELNDGSMVELYVNSRIDYPRNLKESPRKVFLKGKAAFKVSEDNDRPFEVVCEGMTTKVLGTEFLVCDLNNDHRVVVMEGKVKVQPNNGNSVVLWSNQQLIMAGNSQTKSIVRHPLKLEPKNCLFIKTPLLEVLSRIEEEYGVQIDYDRELYKNCKLTADLSELDFFKKLEIIANVFKLKYSEKDGIIFLHGGRCM